MPCGAKRPKHTARMPCANLGELLRVEEGSFLEGTFLEGTSPAVVPFGHIEDHDVGMQLRSCIAVDRRAVSCSNFAATNLPVISAALFPPIRAWV